MQSPKARRPAATGLELVVYDPATGQPLAATAVRRLAGAQAVLGNVEVATARPAIGHRSSALADFGPLRLVEASTPATAVSPGDEIPLSLLWQAAPDYQPEPLVVVVQLLDEDGQVVASLEEEPLAGRYPTTPVAGRRVGAGPCIVWSCRLTCRPARTSLSLASIEQRTDDVSKLPTGPLGLRNSDHYEIKDLMVQ